MINIQWIRAQVETGNYQLKLHAVERASLRGIDPLEVKEARAVLSMGRRRVGEICTSSAALPLIYSG